MKYLQTLQERLAGSTEFSNTGSDAGDEVIGAEDGPLDVTDNTAAAGTIVPPEDLADVEAEEPTAEIVDDDSELDTSGIKGATWTAEMAGNGDYKLSFKNLEGKNTTCVFKDTGNRRMGGAADMSAAFVGLPGTAGDGKNYVAEALMKKNSEGNYEIQSFIIYEH